MTPEQTFIIALFAAVTPIVALVIAALFKIHQLHQLVNSRLTKLLVTTAESSRAKGKLEGAASQAKKSRT